MPSTVSLKQFNLIAEYLIQKGTVKNNVDNRAFSGGYLPQQNNPSMLETVTTPDGQQKLRAIYTVLAGAPLRLAHVSSESPDEVILDIAEGNPIWGGRGVRQTSILLEMARSLGDLAV